MNQKIIGKIESILSKLRASGISRREIAQNIGVTEMTVYRWEKGESKPSIHLQRSIVNFINRISK